MHTPRLRGIQSFVPNEFSAIARNLLWNFTASSGEGWHIILFKLSSRPTMYALQTGERNDEPLTLKENRYTVAEDKRLFTPGPLNTRPEVRRAMLRDLGSRDAAFISAVRDIRRGLLELAGQYGSPVPCQSSQAGQYKSPCQSSQAGQTGHRVNRLRKVSTGHH